MKKWYLVSGMIIDPQMINGSPRIATIVTGVDVEKVTSTDDINKIVRTVKVPDGCQFVLLGLTPLPDWIEPAPAPVKS